MQTNEKIAGTLNDLLTRNYDAEKGYTEAGNNVDNRQLRQWMFDNAERRKRFGTELKGIISTLGETPDKGSSFLGTVHRAWMDLKSSMTSNTEEAILEECIRGEEKAVEDYDEVLKELTLPTNIQQTVRKQRDEIHAACQEVKQLEKSYDKMD